MDCHWKWKYPRGRLNSKSKQMVVVLALSLSISCLLPPGEGGNVLFRISWIDFLWSEIDFSNCCCGWRRCFSLARNLFVSRLTYQRVLIYLLWAKFHLLFDPKFEHVQLRELWAQCCIVAAAPPSDLQQLLQRVGGSGPVCFSFDCGFCIVEAHLS